MVEEIYNNNYWKSKLFKDAPVWVSIEYTLYGINKKILPYNKCFTKERLIRLPTIEEAYRNVWLCPWDIMPEELKQEGIYYLVWFSSGDMENHNGITIPLSESWDEVMAIMILGDLNNGQNF